MRRRCGSTEPPSASTSARWVGGYCGWGCWQGVLSEPPVEEAASQPSAGGRRTQPLPARLLWPLTLPPLLTPSPAPPQVYWSSRLEWERQHVGLIPPPTSTPTHTQHTHLALLLLTPHPFHLNSRPSSAGVLEFTAGGGAPAPCEAVSAGGGGGGCDGGHWPIRCPRRAEGLPGELCVVGWGWGSGRIGGTSGLEAGCAAGSAWTPCAVFPPPWPAIATAPSSVPHPQLVGACHCRAACPPQHPHCLLHLPPHPPAPGCVPMMISSLAAA